MKLVKMIQIRHESYDGKISNIHLDLNHIVSARETLYPCQFLVLLKNGHSLLSLDDPFKVNPVSHLELELPLIDARSATDGL